MSFVIYAEDGFVFVEYVPQKGTKFLEERLGFDFIEIDDNGRAYVQECNTLFEKSDFSKINDLCDKISFSEDYVKNSIRLTRANISKKILDENFNREEKIIFVFGVLEGDYYRFPKYLVSAYNLKGFLNFDILIHKDVNISKKLFFHDSSELYFEIINEIKPDTQVVIGGQKEGAIPIADFEKIIKKLPTRHGYSSYMRARIESLFGKYFDIQEDYIGKYKSYLNKKSLGGGFKFLNDVREFEASKYSFIHERLTHMLKEKDDYSEAEWQKDILDIVLVVFPKYARVIKELSVKTPEGKNKRLDFGLLTTEGHLDLIEIKRPFDNCLIYERQYRDNYIPARELSGTVMQIEKYIYYLNKWGKAGEEHLTKKYENILGSGVSRVKITNPRAVLILGRDTDLNEDQKNDLEIIKRQYSNISDIITYDDLLRRLESLITLFTGEVKGDDSLVAD